MRTLSPRIAREALEVAEAAWLGARRGRTASSELARAGAAVVQFDGPVLTELVFAGKSSTRTFMCAALAALPRDRAIGFGTVNPRTDEIEDPEWIAARARRLTEALGHERVHLNPDCGFGTFAERPVNTAETARRKLEALAAAARILRS